MSKQLLLSLSALALLCQCQKKVTTQSVQVVTLANSCQFNLEAKPFSTLENVEPFYGKFGKFVQIDKEINQLDDLYNLIPSFFSTKFYQSGNSYYPKTYASLTASTVYYWLEQTSLYLAGLDSRADLSVNVSNLSETYLTYKPRLKLKEDGFDLMTDNAAYINIGRISHSGQNPNFVLLFPTEDLKGAPLSLNPGILVHESTHYISQYLWGKQFNFDNLDSYSLNILLSLDEGFSDYVGFVLTGDPNFISCSTLTNDRNLAEPKQMASQNSLPSSSNYDEHVGGAVWAAAQYQIGNQLPGGHAENLRSLLSMLATLSSCTGSSNVTFQKLGQCHISRLGSNSGFAQSIYQQAFSGGF